MKEIFKCFLTFILFQVNDTVIDGVRVKVYEPFSTIRSADRAVFVFMHGGGWSTLSVGKCKLTSINYMYSRTAMARTSLEPWNMLETGVVRANEC